MIFRNVQLIFLLIVALGCNYNSQKEPLNVIILIVDDMGYGDIAAHGNPLIKTPNFDKLCNQSARFTNFAVSPTCAPTRAALMTGKHEFLSGVTHTIDPMRNMDTSSVTLAHLFQEKGYTTGLFGKWHLGQSGNYGPWFRGFDETITVPEDSQDSHFDPVLLKNRVEKKYEGYREDILFSEALSFISANKDKPFFCYLATYSPHAPNVVPKEYSEPYVGLRNPEIPDAVFKPEFFGQIANIDENLGKLSDYIESSGLDEKTLLIVMSDNGGTWGVDTYNSGMRGIKGTPWYGGTRVFSFWHWVKKLPPGERQQMCGHVDILPTLADLCGLNISAELQHQLEGNSLRPVLENPDTKLNEDRMQVHHLGRWDIPEKRADHKYAGCAVRWEHYTLVRNEPCNDESCRTCFYARVRGMDQRKALYTGNNEHYALTSPGKWELFEIDSDPFQLNNIAEENQDIVKKMTDYYDKWWAKVEERMKDH